MHSGCKATEYRDSSFVPARRGMVARRHTARNLRVSAKVRRSRQRRTRAGSGGVARSPDREAPAQIPTTKSSSPRPRARRFHVPGRGLSSRRWHARNAPFEHVRRFGAHESKTKSSCAHAIGSSISRPGARPSDPSTSRHPRSSNPKRPPSAARAATSRSSWKRTKRARRPTAVCAKPSFAARRAADSARFGFAW